MKKLKHNNRGETLIEGVCAMAIFLIAVFIFIGAVAYTFTMLNAAGDNDEQLYTEFTTPDTSLTPVIIELSGTSYTYQARISSNSAGLVYLETNDE